MVNETTPIDELVDAWRKDCPDEMPSFELIEALALFTEGMLHHISMTVARSGVEPVKAGDTTMKLFRAAFVSAAQRRMEGLSELRH
jgi:hypothetical protein